MTKPKYKQPLESFDPRMMQLLLRGSRNLISIPFANRHDVEGSGRALAITFHRRLQTLRARMRDNDHPQAINVARAYVRTLWGIKAVHANLVGEDMDTKLAWMRDKDGKLGAFVVVQPRDIEFDEVLSEIDRVLGEEPTVQPIPESTSEESAPLSVDDLLRTLPGFEK